MDQQPQSVPTFAALPLELFLTVLDQLVGSRHGRQPIYAPSEPVTKTLRALTLTSREIYPIASRYLYAHCAYLNNCTNYTRFRRTLNLSLGNHPQALAYGQAGRNEILFAEAGVQRHIYSLFFSPQVTETCGKAVPMVRLPQIIDLCNAVGGTLRRLIMDLTPIYAPHSEVELVKPHVSTNNIFCRMTNLEELVCSYDITDYFPYGPPRLKNLAVTSQGSSELLLSFAFAIPTLNSLFILRDPEMDAASVSDTFAACPPSRRTPIDVVLVDVYANHKTPEWSRSWEEGDMVKFWEVDVPTSFYGDEDDLILCDAWVWNSAVQGTLFGCEKRRMASWRQVRDL